MHSCIRRDDSATMILSGSALPGVLLSLWCLGKQGWFWILGNIHTFPCGTQLDWVRNTGQRCPLSPTLSHPGSEPLLFPEKTSSGRFSRKTFVLTQVWFNSDKLSLKNLSVFGGLPDASLKTSVFHVVFDHGSALNKNLFMNPFLETFTKTCFC